MSNSNLGLNRKISSVVSKNLTDTESDIYKQISEIVSEYTVDEADEDSGIVAIIERGKDNVTEFKEKRITVITQNMFSDFPNLTYLYLPNVTSIGDSAFYSCSNLISIDLPNVTSIGDSAFESCNNLSTVIMSTNQIITLEDKSVFNDTPISNKTGYIYVPDSLVNSYKSTSGWSTYASQIKPISELPQEYKTLYNIT
jgi:hypothetical protein